MKTDGKYCGGVAQAGFQGGVDAALEILARGGNAIDAGTAALLVLSVRGIGTTCIGGEVPILFYGADTGKVTVLSGQGAAPTNQLAIDWYLENGIPAGDIRASAVPALVDACVQALRLYGTLTFAEVSHPALAMLEAGGDNWYRDTLSNHVVCGLSGRPISSALEGFDTEGRNWHADLAATFRKLVEAEQTASGDREDRLQAVSDRFYRGDIAEDLAHWYVEHGGFLRRSDLARHTTHIEEPISVNYRGNTVYKCGPWTQGPYVAQALRLLEGWNLSRYEMLGADHIHLVTEAMKLALADRDEHYGDPLMADVPIQELLCDQYTSSRRSLIDMGKASHAVRPGDPRQLRPLMEPSHEYASDSAGTTTCAVTDRWGNVFVSTPSGVGSMAGSGARTGITHGTRLVQFNTLAGHPNCIASGKRPRTTLSPSLVLKDGMPVLALSIPSGHLQDQAALQMIVAMIDFKQDHRTLATLPRFFTRQYAGGTKISKTVLGSLRLPESIDSKTRRELEARGHVVTTLRRDVGGISMLAFDHQNSQCQFAGDAPGGWIGTP